MNTFIVSVCTFACGLIIGATALAVCNVKAFDYDEPRFNDGYMQRQQQLQQIQEMELRQQQMERRQRNPCP